MASRPLELAHPLRRHTVLQVGAAAILGLGENHVSALRQVAADEVVPGSSRPRAVIYIFLSGGLAQHDSFGSRPDAPADIRGEFTPIAIRTPGVHICEHLNH